ncbi:glycosyltransferase 87 family protein [Halorarum salinum]|uniref:DUF2029 domain-containing protein n=1 Tax=Halorarum salinum TaxID=2743089 RepID=A0A7D5QC66_9EURY|nr:glycosyltransferase 87 family protein [Halobaculum salinum]QLG62839.1 DUF2029 domain-containing protein [Halobaculum salinum]
MDQYLPSPWTDLPASTRHWILIGLLFVTPGAFLINSGSIANWGSAAASIIQGESVYSIVDVTSDGRPVSAYPYLPSFAILLTVPFALSWVAFHSPIGLPLSPSTSLLSVAVTSIGAYLLLLASAGWYWQDRDATPASGGMLRADFAVIALVAYVPLWIRVGFRGADVLVAALCLLSVVLFDRRRFALAGIAIGVSTFKFTALPAALVLTGVVFLEHGTDKETRRFIGGGVISQLPNLGYFALHPGDLMLLIENRGAVSRHAGEGGSGFAGLFQPIGPYYESLVFPLLLIVFVGLGIYVATSNELLAGMAVGFIPMVFFIPAEVRYLPFGVFLLVLLAGKWGSVLGAVSTGLILTTGAYTTLSSKLGSGDRWGMLWEIGGISKVHLLVLAVCFVGLLLSHRLPRSPIFDLSPE